MIHPVYAHTSYMDINVLFGDKNFKKIISHVLKELKHIQEIFYLDFDSVFSVFAEFKRDRPTFENQKILLNLDIMDEVKTLLKDSEMSLNCSLYPHEIRINDQMSGIEKIKAEFQTYEAERICNLEHNFFGPNCLWRYVFKCGFSMIFVPEEDGNLNHYEFIFDDGVTENGYKVDVANKIVISKTDLMGNEMFRDLLGIFPNFIANDVIEKFWKDNYTDFVTEIMMNRVRPFLEKVAKNID